MSVLDTSTRYVGTVDLTFIIDETQDLGSLITNTNLGQALSGQVTEAAIQTAVDALNPDAISD
jgi:hypothetical protein